MTRLSLPLPETIDLSEEQKEELCYHLEQIEQAIESVKETVPELADYNIEKVLGFLAEMRVITKLSFSMGEEFKPVQGAYVAALDAVGERSTAQIKIMTGHTHNSAKINAKSGSTIQDYIQEILSHSGKKKAYLVFYNHHEKNICYALAKNFIDRKKTYLSWSDLVASKGSKTIRV
jgi:hypothetical protein